MRTSFTLIVFLTTTAVGVFGSACTRGGTPTVRCIYFQQFNGRLPRCSNAQYSARLAVKPFLLIRNAILEVVSRALRTTVSQSADAHNTRVNI